MDNLHVIIIDFQEF